MAQRSRGVIAVGDLGLLLGRSASFRWSSWLGMVNIDGRRTN